MTERGALAAMIVLPFTVWYWGAAFWTLRHPASLPYIDNDFVARFVFPAQTIMVLGWVVFLTVTRVRSYSELTSRWLVSCGMQFYSITFGFVSYYFGNFTAPFGGIVMMAGALVGMLLFGRRIALPGMGTFLVIILATTIGEQMGLLPHAPLFVDRPLVDNRLAPAYLFLAGVPMFGALMVGVVLCYFIIERARDHERRLAEAHERLAQANDIVSRYVASQLVEQIRRGDVAVGAHTRRRLTLFFSDVEGFSSVADEVEPEDLSEVLNEYLSEMTIIGERYGATIDKFVGDAIMIFFGAPTATNDRDHALRAVRMAIEMQRRMMTLEEKWRRQGFERPFRIRIGINTGLATIGNFGSDGRMDYTAIGRQVNLAARLQTHCEPGRILVSQSAWTLVRDEIACIPKGEVALKGFSRPVAVYEVE